MASRCDSNAGSEDTAKSFAQHKGNVERYVRDLYKKGEQDKKDKAEYASTMAKINAVRPLPPRPSLR
jgi:hypothetical protein